MFKHIIFISCCLFTVLTCVEGQGQDNKYENYYERIDACKETCNINETWEIFDPELLKNLRTEFETANNIEEKMQIATYIMNIFHARLPLIVQVDWEDNKIKSRLIDKEEMDKIYEMLTSDLWFFQGILWETTTYTNNVNKLIREDDLDQAEWNAKKALKSVNKSFRLKEATSALAYLYRTLYYLWEKKFNALEQELKDREALDKSQKENIAPEISTITFAQKDKILKTTTEKITEQTDEKTNIPENNQENEILEEQDIIPISLKNKELEQKVITKKREETSNEIETLKQDLKTQKVVEEIKEKKTITKKIPTPTAKEEIEQKEVTEKINEEINISKPQPTKETLINDVLAMLEKYRTSKNAQLLTKIKVDLNQIEELDDSCADLYYAKALLTMATEYDSAPNKKQQNRACKKAEKALKQALKLDPNHQNAKKELKKIEPLTKPETQRIIEEAWEKHHLGLNITSKFILGKQHV